MNFIVSKKGEPQRGSPFFCMEQVVSRYGNTSPNYATKATLLICA